MSSAIAGLDASSPLAVEAATDIHASTPELTIYAHLAVSGALLTIIKMKRNDTLGRLRELVAQKAGETVSLWVLIKEHLLTDDNQTLEEVGLVDCASISIVRCEPVPSVPPPYAPSNIEFHIRWATSGERLGTLQLWPTEKLAMLREMVALKVGESRPLQLLLGSRLLIGPFTIMEAGIRSGVTIDVVVCKPHFLLTASADQSSKLWSLNTDLSSSASSSSGDEAHAVCMMTLQHGDWVNSAVVSPNGQLIAVALCDHTAQVWSADGLPLLTLRGHQNAVLSTTFSSDSYMLITASDDSKAKIWNLDDGSCRLTLAGHASGVLAASFSPLRTLAVTASHDRTLRLWNLETGDCSKILHGHMGEVRSATFSPDGSFVVSASDDQTVRLWNVELGECIRTFSGHSAVQYVAFSCHGELLVTAGADHIGRLWSVDSTDCLLEFIGHADILNSAAFSSDGQYIVTSSVDNTAKIWHTETGRCAVTLRGHADVVMSATFAPLSSTDQETDSVPSMISDG